MLPVRRKTQLVRALVDLADTLVADYDVADMLHQLTGYCVELLGTTAAGVLLSDQQRGGLQIIASSNEQTRPLVCSNSKQTRGPAWSASEPDSPSWSRTWKPPADDGPPS